MFRASISHLTPGKIGATLSKPAHFERDEMETLPMAKPLKNPDAPRLNKSSRNSWKMIQLHYAILREAAADGVADVDAIKQRAGILATELASFAAGVARAQSDGHVPANGTAAEAPKGGKAARA